MGESRTPVILIAHSSDRDQSFRVCKKPLCRAPDRRADGGGARDATFDMLKAALGKFADTLLGKAALKRVEGKRATQRLISVSFPAQDCQWSA